MRVLNSRFELREERINKHEDRAIEVIQFDRKKGIKKMNTFRADMIIYLEKILELKSGYKTGTGYYANIKN